MKGTLLIVEDDRDLSDLIAYNLRREGYQVLTASSGAQALKLLDSQRIDLILLDIMLPDYDGYRIAQYVRSRQDLRMIPILFITAKDREEDKLKGFSVGGDDYITKPFSIKELLARVRAVLMRSKGVPPGRVHNIGDITVDLDTKKVWKGGTLVSLTPSEFRILEALLENRGKPVSRERLVENYLDRDVFDRTVDVHIKNLREKLGKDVIKTVRGFGYKIE
ncbi:response regulator transcription factor [Thermocrinis minervae]|uniref:Two-component system, OmpR family, response regulator/two-component system, OmpR family, phosphate regulon response regulator PhoB n=1 Tax=Thermocrinis minervae TaxID=381751 RepID=A0A1M6Q300_9AQUI|nr:response regulator transcription factor [Thermocrinis minervae]SHK14604.1 two-component system, OmpR family, response regulator/two-component system, OmpR family, phosphate regulon response regulator PhoB [Thermocrinis minervae]